MNTAVVHNEFGIEATKVQQLRDNIHKLTDELDIVTILKSRRLLKSASWIQDHRFQNERRVYDVIKKTEFRFFNAPAVLKSNPKQLLLEFVERNPEKVPSIEDFSNGYIELQRLEIPTKLWLDLKNQLLRGLFYKGLVIPVLKLSKKIDFLICVKVVFLFLKLWITNKKQGRKYWLHFDLHNDNIFYNIKNDKLYFIDFENMIFTRRWMLIEPCGMGFGYGRAANTDYNIRYLTDYLSKVNPDELKKVNIKAQVRMGMLLRCLSIIVNTKVVAKRNWYISLLVICVSREKFNKWYEENIIPHLGSFGN